MIAGRAREERVEVGLACVRDPRLDPVQDVIRPVRVGPGPQRGRVGPAGRLGQAVSAKLLPAQHPRQPEFLLLRRARGGQWEAGQRVHAYPESDGQPGAGQLFHHLEVGLVRLAAAAEPFRVGQREQAGPAQDPESVPREQAVALCGVGSGAQFLVGQFPGQLEKRSGLVIRAFPLDGTHLRASDTTPTLGLHAY